MDQVEVDRQPAERGKACLAVAQERLCAPVGDPFSMVARHPAFGDDPRSAIGGAGAALKLAISACSAVLRSFGSTGLALLGAA